MPLEIRLAYQELDEIKKLFDEYVGMLGVDLTYQNYKGELENLPGMYGLPRGRLYIASYGGNPAGCIALRPLNEEICEMKRLFVKPKFREHGIGEALAKKIIEDAKHIGYGFMVLDTMTAMKSAVKLYKRLGFYETEPYCYSPVDNALFLRLNLCDQDNGNCILI